MILFFFLLFLVLNRFKKLTLGNQKKSLGILLFSGIIYNLINALFLYLEFGTATVGSDAEVFYKYALQFEKTLNSGENPFIAFYKSGVSIKYFLFILFDYLSIFLVEDIYLSFLFIRLNIFLVLMLGNIRVIRSIDFNNMPDSFRNIVYISLFIFTLYGSSANFRDPLIAVVLIYLYTEDLITKNNKIYRANMVIYIFLLFFLRNEYVVIVILTYFLIWAVKKFKNTKHINKYLLLLIASGFLIWYFVPLPTVLKLNSAIITHQEETGMSRGDLLELYNYNSDLAGKSFSERFVTRFPATIFGSSPIIFVAYYFTGVLESSSWHIAFPYFIVNFLFRLIGFFAIMPMLISLSFQQYSGKINTLTSTIFTFIFIILSIYSVYHLGMHDRIRLTIYPLILIAFFNNKSYLNVNSKIMKFIIGFYIVFSFVFALTKYI